MLRKRGDPPVEGGGEASARKRQKKGEPPAVLPFGRSGPAAPPQGGQTPFGFKIMKSRQDPGQSTFDNDPPAKTPVKRGQQTPTAFKNKRDKSHQGGAASAAKKNFTGAPASPPLNQKLFAAPPKSALKTPGNGKVRTRALLSSTALLRSPLPEFPVTQLAFRHTRISRCSPRAWNAQKGKVAFNQSQNQRQDALSPLPSFESPSAGAHGSGSRASMVSPIFFN